MCFFSSALVSLAVVSCRPDKSDLKQLKAEAARKKACMHDCTSAKFEPVCAGKTGEKPKSFGSECVLNNYNCEHKDSKFQWVKLCRILWGGYISSCEIIIE